MRWCAITAAAGATLLIGAAPAHAANLFASPSGDPSDPNDCTNVAAPCSIERAVEVVAVSGDDVTLLPGTYNLTDDLVFLESSFGAITVHGAPGARPQINVALSAVSQQGVLVRGAIRDVTIVETGTVPTRLLHVEQSGDLAERVYVHASLDGSFACDVSGTLRDSVCWAEGDNNSIGARIARGPTFSGTATLRNVTAIATGMGGVGVHASSGGMNSNATINGLNVIARGDSPANFGADVQAVNGGTTATVSLDFSNYATEDEVAGGTVTNPGTLNNETAAPVFRDPANGDFRQTPASAGTIDQGSSAPGLGMLDLDGQERNIGMAPDIGADELANSTSTSVSCSPSTLTLGSGSSNCTVTVTDTALSPDVPTGVATLSGGSGAGGTCTLAMVSGNQASCQAAYTPVAAGTHQVTAAYSGDNLHDPSQGTTGISVAAPPPPPAPSIAPVTPTAKKKCKKGRKLKKGKCVKKRKKRK